MPDNEPNLTASAERAPQPSELPPDAISAEAPDPYDENGDHLWQHVDTGEPVDNLGNIIPATRPAPEPTAALPVEEPPQPEPAPASPMQFRSPFAEGVLTPDEMTAAEALVSPEAMALIETVASRIAARTIAADRQQVRAARELGMPDEYAERMGNMQQYVPANLRGTKEGAIMAAALAAAQEGIESGDLQSVFRRLGGVSNLPAPATAPAAQPARIPLPPSSVTHTPVGSPDAARQAQRQRPEQLIAGLTREQLAAINEDRASRNGGRW